MAVAARGRGKRKVHPQLIVLELILLAAFAAGAYFLAEHLAHGAMLPVFLAGAAADRALILVLRHRNKRLLPQMPVTVQRRKTARGRR